jgi:PTS system mannose-specific IIC component
MELTFTTKVVFLLFFGGFFYLDRVPLLQMMFHRPLVVSVVVGALFGRVAECSMLGILLEMLWVSKLPVGASLPPDDTGAAIFGSFALVVLSSLRKVGYADIALVAAASVFVGEMGRSGDVIVRRVNGKITKYAVEAVRVGDFKTLDSCIYASIIVWFLMGLILTASWLFLALLVGKYAIPLLPVRAVSVFQIMYFIIPATGAVSVFQHCKVGKGSAVFHMALASGAIVFVVVEMGIF